MKWVHRLGLISLIFGVENSHGSSMGNYHEEGKAFVQDFKNTKPKAEDLEDVTGYQGTNIEQAKYGEHDLKNKIGESLASSEEGQFLSESQNTRPRFDIDPSTHPLLTTADSVVNNPEESLNVIEVQGEESDEKAIKRTIHTCIKGQDHFERKCHRTLTPHKSGVRLEEKEYLVNFNITDFPFLYDGTLPYTLENYSVESDKRILDKIKKLGSIVDVISKKKVDIVMGQISKARVYNYHGKLKTVRKNHKTNQFVEIKLTTSVEIPTYELSWVDDCEALETVADRGDCEYAEFRCIEGRNTKIIEGVPLTADCWSEERIYSCRGNPKDTCQELVKKGCVQISSECKSFEGKDCVEWEQTYQCEEGPKNLITTSLSGERPFCLDGDCTDQSWAPNQDMADALSKLAIFQNFKKDMDPKTRTVFGGKVGKCSRLVTSFKDCCQKNGWGMKVGLSSCNAKEKELAEHRKRNKCVRVKGTYCSKKELGICVKKKTSFCCYPSKLARIINEQGKKQLGLSFGTPRNPKCEGLTLDQLTQLDFSTIDLSELFQDIMAQVKIPNGTKVNEEIQKSMANKTYSVTDKSKNITQGRSNDNF